MIEKVIAERDALRHQLEELRANIRQTQAHAAHYWHAQIEIAVAAALDAQATPPAVQAQSVEQPNLACKSVQKRLATQRGYAQALTDERLDSLIEKHLRSYWSYGAVEQDKLRRAVREIIGAAAQGGEHG